MVYTCPMHPEIRRQGPGDCPICGMALEPAGVPAEEDENPELIAMTRRFWVSTVLALPLLVLTMGDLIPGRPLEAVIAHPHTKWGELALATPIVLWGAWPFFVRGWASVVNRHLNMFTLIGLGVGVAYAYSVVATVAPGLSRSTGAGNFRQYFHYSHFSLRKILGFKPLFCLEIVSFTPLVLRRA